MKSTVDEIRERFDNDVERFANLETGQSATIDAPLALELIARAAVATTPQAMRLLDVGCGAGNFSLRLLELHPLVEITLIDLSRPMLDRAAQRIKEASGLTPTTIQDDIRTIRFEDDRFDIILAGAVLHHLRTDEEWESTFAKLFQSLELGGSFWVFDLVTHPNEAVQEMMRQRYGDYLTTLRDEAYRDQVFQYIDKEDTPRPVMYQLDLLRRVGFTHVDLLHYNTCFAAFGGLKPGNCSTSVYPWCPDIQL